MVYGLMMCCINNRRRECGNIHRRLLPNREDSTARTLVKLYHGRPLHGFVGVGFFMPVYKTVSPLGLEPRTHGLKGHCSAIELGAHLCRARWRLLRQSCHRQWPNNSCACRGCQKPQRRCTLCGRRTPALHWCADFSQRPRPPGQAGAGPPHGDRCGAIFIRINLRGKHDGKDA